MTGASPASRANPRWTGVLLVGGASTRMGQDKLQMRLPAGDLLSERPARALARSCGRLIAAHRGDRTSSVPAGFLPVEDQEPGGGPLAGVMAALAVARTPWLLIVGGDMPDLRADFLRRFMAQAETDPARAMAIGRGRHLESMPLALPLALAGEVEQRFLCGERALRRAVTPARLRVMDAECFDLAAGERPWLSLNTPADWQAYVGSAAAGRE